MTSESWDARVAVFPTLDLSWSADVREAWHRAFAALWHEAESLASGPQDTQSGEQK